MNEYHDMPPLPGGCYLLWALISFLLIPMYFIVILGLGLIVGTILFPTENQMGQLAFGLAVVLFGSMAAFLVFDSVSWGAVMLRLTGKKKEKRQ